MQRGQAPQSQVSTRPDDGADGAGAARRGRGLGGGRRLAPMDWQLLRQCKYCVVVDLRIAPL